MAAGREEGRVGKAQVCALQRAPLQLSFSAQGLLVPRGCSQALLHTGLGAHSTASSRSPSGSAPLIHLQSWKENRHIHVLLFALTLSLVLLTVSCLPGLGKKQKVPELLLLQDITRMKETP